jgi:molecular chaperone DnaK (HSP70)
VKEAFTSPGRPRELDFTFHRDHLAPHWAPLVQRSVDAAVQTVHDAAITKGDLAGLLLIGGTTYVPQVRNAVAQEFQRPCVFEDDPQTAVARGAAQLAAQPALLAA